jgi:hypothetical protein
VSERLVLAVVLVTVVVAVVVVVPANRVPIPPTFPGTGMPVRTVLLGKTLNVVVSGPGFGTGRPKMLSGARLAELPAGDVTAGVMGGGGVMREENIGKGNDGMIRFGVNAGARRSSSTSIWGRNPRPRAAVIILPP